MKLKKFRNALLFALTLALISATAVAITYALGKSIGSAENTYVLDWGFTNSETTPIPTSLVGSKRRSIMPAQAFPKTRSSPTPLPKITPNMSP